jgi:hypothetical protein
MFGQLENNNIVMTECPLHETSWAQEWKIRVKPDFAGVRVLSLDGCVDPGHHEYVTNDLPVEAYEA